MSLQGIDPKNPRVRFGVAPGSALSGLDLNQRLVSFEYSEELGKGDEKVDLVFENSDGELMSLDRIALGVALDISWGYPELWSPVRRLVIRKIKGGVARAGARLAGGNATVVYEGHGKLVDMNRIVAADAPRVFRNIKVSDIAAAIAKRNGFAGSTVFVEDTEQVHEQVVMTVGESEAQFLHRLARMEKNFTFSISDKGFHFGSERIDPPTETIGFFYGPDVLTYEVEGDWTLPNPDTVVVSRPTVGGAVDKTTGRTAAGLVGRFGRPTAERVRSLSSFDEVLGPPSRTADKMAVRRLEKAAFNSWKLKLTVVGNPRIFVRTTLNLDNFGPLLDGLWLVRKVKHRIESGYQTTVEMGRKGLSKSTGTPVVGGYTAGGRTPGGGVPVDGGVVFRIDPRRAGRP